MLPQYVLLGLLGCVTALDLRLALPNGASYVQLQGDFTYKGAIYGLHSKRSNSVDDCKVDYPPADSYELVFGDGVRYDLNAMTAEEAQEMVRISSYKGVYSGKHVLMI
ncbi:hypothetical protein HJFPF1_08089 [Paramyrothecium foliicola]|nr:hypothetical protein HJFPF1_08089 [Paramyrothecium foliicola]